MDKVVWLWLRAYWQLLVTSIVIVWFLFAIIQQSPAQRFASSTRVEGPNAASEERSDDNKNVITINTTTTLPVLISSTVPRPTNLTSPSTVARPRTSPRSGNSGNSGVTNNYSESPSNSLNSNGEVIIDSSSALAASSLEGGSMAITLKSFDVHPTSKKNEWELVTAVEVKNLTNRNIEFDPSRLSARIGGTTAIYPDKPIRAVVSPQIPVLVPLQFTTNTQPSSLRNVSLSYSGVALQLPADAIATR